MNKFIFLSLLIFSLTAKTQDKTKEKANNKPKDKPSNTFAPVKETSKNFKFYPTATTLFPVFAGGGLGLIFKDSLDLRVQYGITPEIYYQVIGDVAASQGGNNAYKDVIESAFQNNTLFKIDGDYYFGSTQSGWLIGGAYSFLQSKGQAGIDQVLTAATKRDYTGLKTLLTLAGRSNQVDIETTLDIVEIHLGYNWSPYPNFIVSTTLGVAKVFAGEIKLKTGLANFESTQAGNTLMRQSETDLENIIIDYGISPTVGLNLFYTF